MPEGIGVKTGGIAKTMIHKVSGTALTVQATSLIPVKYEVGYWL